MREGQVIHPQLTLWAVRVQLSYISLLKEQKLPAPHEAALTPGIKPALCGPGPLSRCWKGAGQDVAGQPAHIIVGETVSLCVLGRSNVVPAHAPSLYLRKAAAGHPSPAHVLTLACLDCFMTFRPTLWVDCSQPCTAQPGTL